MHQSTAMMQMTHERRAIRMADFHYDMYQYLSMKTV
jgi:hypothetical protein